MKKYLILLICLNGCKTEQNISFVNVSKEVYKVQSKEANRFSASAYIGRKLLNTKVKNFYINKSDTPAEPDLKIGLRVEKRF